MFGILHSPSRSRACMCRRCLLARRRRARYPNELLYQLFSQNIYHSSSETSTLINSRTRTPHPPPPPSTEVINLIQNPTIKIIHSSQLSSDICGKSSQHSEQRNSPKTVSTPASQTGVHHLGRGLFPGNITPIHCLGQVVQNQRSSHSTLGRVTPLVPICPLSIRA